MKSLIFSWCLVLFCPVFSLAFPADVTAVLDGDTLVVSHAERAEKIRLYGVDCPEKRQAFGAEAAALAVEALKGRHVEIIPKDTDKYGRTVAVVKLEDGQTLQERLLNSGAAWVYGQYCNSLDCFQWKWLEYQAQRKGVGLWADKNPTPPWVWRKGNAGK